MLFSGRQSPTKSTEAGVRFLSDLYAKLGQFSKRTPKLDEVMTLDVLKASADARPKIG